SYLRAPAARVAGRLDFDSEGLLLLTDHGPLQARITQPVSHLPKTYWVQVDGQATVAAIERLRTGVKLSDGSTRPSLVQSLDEAPAGLWPRTPPVRYRAAIPTSWLTITITQGRNRQVRRMTAAVGFPTLRLIRAQIGPWALDGLAPGASRVLTTDDAWAAIDQVQPAGRSRR
ncbi:MAG: pseudouridine synthase, partial [Steroidobacteraceae bacterium]